MFFDVSRESWGVSLAWMGKWIAWKRALPGGLGDRRKLCTLSCYSCHLPGTWRSKKVVGDVLNSSFGVAIQKGGNSFMGIKLTFWNFSSSLTGYCKSLYSMPLFITLAVLTVLYLLIYDKLGASINVYLTYNTVSSFWDNISDLIWY